MSPLPLAVSLLTHECTFVKVGRTAVHIAAKENHIGCLRILLKKDADPNTKTRVSLSHTLFISVPLIHAQDGDTPAHYAGSLECLRLLFEYGANPHAINNVRYYSPPSFCVDVSFSIFWVS